MGIDIVQVPLDDNMENIKTIREICGAKNIGFVLRQPFRYFRKRNFEVYDASDINVSHILSRIVHDLSPDSVLFGTTSVDHLLSNIEAVNS